MACKVWKGDLAHISVAKTYQAEQPRNLLLVVTRRSSKLEAFYLGDALVHATGPRCFQLVTSIIPSTNVCRNPCSCHMWVSEAAAPAVHTNAQGIKSVLCVFTQVAFNGGKKFYFLYTASELRHCQDLFGPT
jgi:hypothetical protein